MVRVDEVLTAIRDGLATSEKLPDEMSFRVRRADWEGSDSGVPLPGVVLTEVTTSRDEAMSSDLVGVVRDDETGQVIGRIFEMGFDMRVQIDVLAVEGSSYDIGDLSYRVRRALQRYDSHIRADLFPDADGGTMGEIRQFAIGQSEPADDFSKTHSLRRERLTASVTFTDRLNEVEEYGPLEPIKEVRTPRDGDYVGGLSDDYLLEYHAPDDTDGDSLSE